jgi:hypothetical protein
MLKVLRIALFALIAVQPAIAADSKPTEESIRQLMAVVQSRKLIDGALGQVDSLMQNSIHQALAGQTVTADQQKILDEMRAKALVILKDEMKWEILEPMFINIYQQSFNQREVAACSASTSPRRVRQSSPRCRS